MENYTLNDQEIRKKTMIQKDIKSTWKILVVVNKKNILKKNIILMIYSLNFSMFRDPARLKKLGWKPKYDLAALVKEMVASDLEIENRF